MQASGRSSDCAGALRKNGLIAVAVRGLIGAFNVGWKRDMAETLEMLFYRALVVRAESQSAQAQLPARNHLRFQFPFAKEHPFTDWHLAARTDKRLPQICFELASKKDFHSS